MMRLRKAFTIVEMIVVLCVIAALASLSLPLVSGTLSLAASATTQSTLNEVAHATSHYWSDCKLVVLDGSTTVATEGTRFQIRWLFRNPINDTSAKTFDHQFSHRLERPLFTFIDRKPLALRRRDHHRCMEPASCISRRQLVIESS